MYICAKCQYTTNVKSNYTRHTKRKTDCDPGPQKDTPVNDSMKVNDHRPRFRMYAALVVLSLFGILKKKRS